MFNVTRVKNLLTSTYRHLTILSKNYCIEIRIQGHALVILSCSHHDMVSLSRNSSSYDMSKFIRYVKLCHMNFLQLSPLYIPFHKISQINTFP